MIKITHIKWGGRKIGVALHKLKDGVNVIKITVKDKAGKLLYPEPLYVDRQKLINIYGQSVINKNQLVGVWIPLYDIERGYFRKAVDVEEVQNVGS